MFRLGGKLRFDKKKKKKFYLGLFEIFPFENWRFLRFWGIWGTRLSITPANKVHARKRFEYYIPILQEVLLPSIPKL